MPDNGYQRVMKMDDDQRIVTAEVYAPFVMDTYGEYMRPEDIEEMAHRFMALDLSNVIDVNHDNVFTSCVVLESYIAKKGDPVFTEGAWVLSIHIPDDELWSRVRSGDLNGFSFEAMVKPETDIVEVSTIRDHVGRTENSKEVDHEHIFFIQVNESGRIVGGVTAPAEDGHTHKILRGTVTEEVDGHTHRFSLS